MREKAQPLGNFLPSKQMVFDQDKVLAPLEAQKKVNENYSPFPKIQQKRDLFDEKIKRISAASQDLEKVKPTNLDGIATKAMQMEKQQLLQIINMLGNGHNSEASLQQYGLPETEEEILNFLDLASLENQPTDVLVQLAEKLKERRNKLYPQEVMVTDDSYEKDMFNDGSKQENSGGQMSQNRL